LQRTLVSCAQLELFFLWNQITTELTIENGSRQTRFWGIPYQTATHSR
jgi:hypothetical protein